MIGKRILKLPAPIGARVYVLYEYSEEDGTIVRGIEETGLAGYINEDGRPFYLCYDSELGSSDVAPSDLFVTREAAEAALKERIS